MKTIEQTKTFEVNQICEMGWGCPRRYDFFIVTRISKSNLWLMRIDDNKIDDYYGRTWGFQKYHSLPSFAVIEGKNVPMTNQGCPIFGRSEFRKKIYTSNSDGCQYAYEKYMGIIRPWDGEVKSNDHMD